MKADDDAKRLEELIQAVLGRGPLPFDFERWKQAHSRQIEEFRTKTRPAHGPGIVSIGRSRTISRGLKIGVAATILLAVLLVVSRFTPSLDGTTAAYAKVTQAVRNVPWMHIRYTGYFLDDWGNKRSEEGALDTEIWYSFNAQTVIQRYHSGVVIYSNYARQKVHVYHPVSKRIVLSALADSQLPFQADSPWTWMERNIQRMTPMGSNITRHLGQYQGREVEVYEIVAAVTPPLSTFHGKIFVDRTTCLPIAEERTYVSTSTGKPDLVETGTFDYPEHGPGDIYALGLSRGIPTIDSLPLPPWWEISSAYESHRRQILAERYLAVVTRQMGIGGNPIDTVDVFWVDGVRCREERHFTFPGYIEEQWERQASELGTTLDSILKWSRAYKAYGDIFIRLFEGNHYYESRRDQNGSWSVTERTFDSRELTKDDFWNMCPVFNLGWPDIWGEAEVVQDDYARKNHLIRLETQRGVFYLNPDRDYICQRRIIHPDDRVEDVTEFGHTDDGRCYPSKVKDRGLTHTIYLDTHPEFPEGIFDPNRLPKAARNRPE